MFCLFLCVHVDGCMGERKKETVKQCMSGTTNCILYLNTAAETIFDGSPNFVERIHIRYI